MNILSIKKTLFKITSRLLPMALTICFIISFSSLAVVYANNSFHALELIKVGIVQPENQSLLYSEEDSSGYYFEYFTMISNYVNWDYEYVFGSQSEIMELAKKGELDLVAGIAKTSQAEELLDFPEIRHGNAYTTLCALPDNNTLDVYDYNTLNGTTVGINRNSHHASVELDAFCKSYNITIRKKYFNSISDLSDAFTSGKIDVALGGNIPISSRSKLIARFSPVTHYIASVKNSGHISELNYALNKVNQNNNTFADELYEKYYQVPDYSNPTFSEDEISFAKKSVKVRVSVPPYMYPMAYTDKGKNGYSGISRDILSDITSHTGLQFEFVKAKSLDDAIQMASSGKTDMTAIIPQDFLLSQKYDLKLTIPYYESQNIMISKDRLNFDNLTSHTLAKLKGSAAPANYEIGKSVTYNNIIDCIDAVRSGKADFTFCNVSTANILLENMSSKNLITSSKANDTCRFSFGLNQNTDKRLLSIIEKVILSSEAVGHFSSIDNKEFHVSPKNFTDYMYAHPKQIIVSILIASILILLILFFTMHNQIKKNRELTEYGKTYKLLADSTGEIGFVYDIENDFVTLSGRNCMQIAAENELHNFKTMLRQKESAFASLTYEKFNNAISTAQIGSNYSSELEIVLISGARKWFRVVYTVISNTHSKNSPSRVIGRLYDIDKERKEHEQLLNISELDPLTKLYNRLSAEKRVSQMLKSSDYKNPGIICLIDVDHFKICNDKYGHQAGDKILKYLAEVLKNSFDRSDIICRWGGDEFWIFSVNNSIESITKKIEIVQSLMRNFELNGKTLPITLSVGGVVAHKGISLDTLFKLADDTLYEVKRAGRSGFIIHQ